MGDREALMFKYLEKILHMRIVRYALVGGIGIPINLLALAGFLYLMGDALYPLALACSFEVSTTVNFILNQLFTYSEQKHVRGWGWVKRALKAQMTSLSALALSYTIALVFKYGVHVSPYLASIIGIVGAFFYNFAISKRFVFRPKTQKLPAVVAQPTHLTQAALNNTGQGQAAAPTDENCYNNWRLPSMQQTEVPGQVTTSEGYSSPHVSREITLSIVVPVMNECKNVRPLYEKLSTVLNNMRVRYEIIFVDDGSTDGTFSELQCLHLAHPNTVNVIRFRKNFGKTPALVAGFSLCRGDVVFTMDGDLQDDPAEIPNFLNKLDEGYDLVSGWKFPRLDPLSKTFPSRVFNGLVNKVTGQELHDINCGFKAYRREVIQDVHLKLYGEFHRLIPVIAHWRGFRIAEIKVHHHPRTSGVSKFGGRRFARGLVDLLTVLFLTSFLHTPLRLFGKLGFFTFLIGNAVDIYVVMRSLFFINEPIHNQPLLFVGILLIIFGVQFLLIGLLGEMIRYYAFQRGQEYSIRQELLASNNDPSNDVLVPAQADGLHYGSSQTTGRMSHPPLSQDPNTPQLQPGWNRPRDSKSRNIPQRATMIPL
jgi:glycosyltransferase involved in cell wall biosynthesis/putative flippase GtrA